MKNTVIKLCSIIAIIGVQLQALASIKSTSQFSSIEEYANLKTKAILKNTKGITILKEGIYNHKKGTKKYTYTKINNTSTNQELTYIWDEKGTLQFIEISHAKVNANNIPTGKTQKITNSSGDSFLGMPLAKLVQWNGAHFTFWGFKSANKGKIQVREGSKMAQCAFEFTLGIEAKTKYNYTVMTELEVNTSYKHILNQKIFVSSFKYFPVKKTQRQIQEVLSSDGISSNASAQVVKAILGGMTIEDYGMINTKEALSKAKGLEIGVEKPIYLEEGTVKYNSTLVVNPATNHELIYVWDKNNNLKFIEMEYSMLDADFIPTGKTQTIMTRKCNSEGNGAFILGMPLKKLIEWNNGEYFDFISFGIDSEGQIIADKSSKLGSCSNIELKLSIEYKNLKKNKAISKGLKLNTTDKATKDAGIFVGSLRYHPSLD